ncbi:hypothetical protein Ait01nite_091230 [Actinoplanes italicus]|nr:hypothetical protein Ait01nite_091230 [Actinoplanes italicus]
MVLLGHLGDAALEAVVIERATDLILVPTVGDPELVSIKHRESNRSGTVAWTWAALQKDNVLTDLHAKWLMYEKKATLAFWSSAGFADATYELWKVCAHRDEPSPQLLSQVSRYLGVSLAEARDFLAALHLPEQPLPRRKEMEDVAVRRTADVLRPLRSDADRTAAACFEALRARIREASTDTAARSTERAARAATLARATARRDSLRIRHEYISRAEAIDLLLRTHDRLSAQRVDSGSTRWEVDPHFVGRAAELADLERALRPGDPHEVAPVLVCGMVGAGKTSLAVQFAALHNDSLRAVVIPGTSRSAVQRAVARLLHPPGNSVPAGENPAVVGSVVNADSIDEDQDQHLPVALPRSAALLLVIDGVTDASAIAGLIPRRSLCRVLITSTVRQIDHGFHRIELSTWSPTESSRFIRAILPDATPSDAASMGSSLGHHPLAVSQAVNYCLASGRPISGFLARLKRQPDIALQRGKVAGHPAGLVSAIELHLRLLRQNDEVGHDLLMLLAHLGPEPIREELLQRVGAYVLVATPYLQDVKVSRWARLKAKTTGRPLADRFIVAEISKHVQRISAELADDAARETAVDNLVERTLVRRAGTNLTVHPLIATVVRQSDSEPLTWIELGLGLFLDQMLLDEPDDLTAALDEDMDHVVALVLLALQHGHSGPAVIVASIAVCRYLANRSGIPPLDTVEAAAEFAMNTLAMTDGLEERNLAPMWMVVRYRKAAAALLQRAGRIDTAIEQLQRTKEIISASPALPIDARKLTLGVLLDLGAIVVSTPRRELAPDILAALDEALTEELDMGPDMWASAGHIRASLLRLLGRTQEATSTNAAALDAAIADGNVSPRLIADLHDSAATLARDMRDPVARLHHEMAVLDYYRTMPGKRVSLRMMHALHSSADATLEVGQLEATIELLTEFEELARTVFGVDSTQYAKHLAIRGRLNLHRDHFEDALSDLEAAAAALRAAGEPEQGFLPAVLVHIGHVATWLGLPDRASTAFAEAIDIDTHVYGPDHPETRADIEIRDHAAISFAAHRGMIETNRFRFRATPSVPAGQYEVMSGRLEIGRDLTGAVRTWRLHQPGIGLLNGVIHGPGRSGRSTLLRFLLSVAARSRRFRIIPTGHAWSSRDRRTWGRHLEATEGPAAVEHRLRRIHDELVALNDEELFTEPSADTPATLIGIDDADSLLHAAPGLVAILERIAVEGPAAGITVILITTDTTLNSFGGSTVLRDAVLEGNQVDHHPDYRPRRR